MVESLPLKALAAPDTLYAMRTAIEGGGFEALVPSAFDALGVYPDHLPWIYIDGYRRLALGLGDQRLATVRVRASRSFQLRRELREMLLVLAVTAFAVLEFMPDATSRVSTGLALLAVTG